MFGDRKEDYIQFKIKKKNKTDEFKTYAKYLKSKKYNKRFKISTVGVGILNTKDKPEIGLHQVFYNPETRVMPTLFEKRDIDLEISLCERYYHANCEH